MQVQKAMREVLTHREPGEERWIRMVLEEQNPLRVEFEGTAAERGLIYRVRRSVGRARELPKAFDERVLFWVEDENSKEVLLEREIDKRGALILLKRDGGYLEIEVAAPELEIARELTREFSIRLGDKNDGPDEMRVCVSFWRDGPHIPDSTERFVDVVRWDDIAANYTASTARKLAPLVRTDPLTLQQGRLMLWYGAPGTGKTYALRALAHEWNSWCDIHYISDPEALLGRAGYLLHLILHETDDETRWRLLVMEDTGELLSIDARQNVGQALSRLLNTTEGLLGQGLRVLFLITTNEELGRLNPAVTRPGRCLSAIEFMALTREESRSWLSKEGVAIEPQGALTLAELYAFKHGDGAAQPTHRCGFLPQPPARDRVVANSLTHPGQDSSCSRK